MLLTPAALWAAGPEPRRRRLRLSRGLEVPIAGAPAQTLEAPPTVSSVALLEQDFPGIRFVPRVELGERVRAGQLVLADRHDPQLGFAAPAAGRVVAIRRGDARRVFALEIAVEGDERSELPPLAEAELLGWSAGQIAERLMATGDWVALRERPFGRIARVARPPAAIFVRAFDSSPLAGDVAPHLRERSEDSRFGLVALARLTAGPVFVCARPGALGELPDSERLVPTEVEGPHPAGLVGTLVHHLFPVSAARHVWYVSHQDLLALGRGLRTGQPDTTRLIALSGPAVRRPRLLRVPLGASSEDLVRGELEDGPSRIISGSLLAGRIAAHPGAFLGRYHEQLCALPASRAEGTAWWLPGWRSAWQVPWWRPAPRALTHVRAEPSGFLPLEALDRAFPLRLPLAPLLRALLAGDADAALALGALELEEEDLALASFLDPTRNDYGRLLRSMLSQLAERLP